MLSDAFKISCKCGVSRAIEEFDTGVSGLFLCPVCGVEFGSMSAAAMSEQARTLLERSKTSCDEFRNSLRCDRLSGFPLEPSVALELMVRIDAGAIRVPQTIRRIIETEGRKTFMESVRGEDVDGVVLDDVFCSESEGALLEALSAANYATVRKAHYLAGQQSGAWHKAVIAAYGAAAFPFGSWGGQ
jgi:hypothetical protein